MTSELTSRLAYQVARARHRRTRSGGGHPIVVFSMAKTGSTAVAAGLRAADVGAVFHVHDLDAAFLEQEEQQYRWAGRPWRIWDAQQLLGRPATPEQPWRVVSIVRDPIAQSISAFFQPGERRGYLHAGATPESLQASFEGRLSRTPTRWFETHVEPALGIDVYAHDFDPEQGYGMISTPSVRLLLLRCEDLAIAPRALAELLGVDHPVEVPRLNVGAEKAYAGLYERFTGSLRPSSAELDRAYTSRAVQHFYSPEEIARFRARWSAGAPSRPDR
jgi:hypothetical protein